MYFRETRTRKSDAGKRDDSVEGLFAMNNGSEYVMLSKHSIDVCCWFLQLQSELQIRVTP